MTEHEQNILEAALEYGRRGWPIFPIKKGAKTPLNKNGCKGASCNELAIRAWWHKHPGANIGMNCCDSSGVRVVDVDFHPEKDIDGYESLGVFADEGKIMPDTLVQLTPTGGRHYFFYTKDAPKNQNDFRTGLDVRSNNYYVLMSPSIHPNGKKYEWETPLKTPLANFPDFCRPELDKKKDIWDFPIIGNTNVDMSHATKPITAEPKQKVHGSDVMKRASLYLQECPPAVEGHGGHEALLWAARAMVVGFSLSAKQASSLLENEFNPRCSPPWDLSNSKDARDFRRKILEVQKTPGSKPQGWLLAESGMCITEQQEAYGNRLRNGVLSQIIEIEKSRVVVKHAHVTNPQKNDEWPSWLLNPPGLVGQIVSWIVESAMCPQPKLAIGAACVGCGSLFGRKVKDESNGRTNLYSMAVAPSSSGKDHPADCITRLFHDSGAGALIGGSQVTSDAAIETALQFNPVQCFFMDEMGQKMEQAKGGGNSFSSSIIPTFTELYSCASKIYKGKQKADVEPRIIDQPCASIFGLSSPSSFANSISRKELESGWLGRMVVFQSYTRQKIQLKPFSPTPQHLIDSVKAWYQREIPVPAGMGNIAALTGAHQILVPTDPRARVILDEFNEYAWQEMCKYADDDNDVQYLWGKGLQNARTLALIVGTGCDFDKPTIDKLSADWACGVMERSIKEFHTVIDDHVSDSYVEQEKKKMVHVIKRTKATGCSRSKLTRKTQFIRDSKTRQAYLDDLVEAGIILCGIGPKTHGKQAAWYWAIPYGIQ